MNPPSLDKSLFVSIDSRRPLPDGMAQLQFIAQNRYVGDANRNSSVFKDYILSPDTYVIS